MGRPRIPGGAAPALLLLLLISSACSGGAKSPAKPTAAADPLSGTSWTLERITHPTGDAPVFPQVRPTIAFAEGRVSGSAGCNTYSGSYSVHGSALDLGPLATTQMACMGDEAVIEVSYLGTMDLVDSFKVDGGTLTLSGSGSSLIYSAGSGSP